MLNLREALDSYLKSQQSNYLAPATLRKTRMLVNNLAALGNKDVRAITPSDLQSFRSSRKISANTASKELQQIKGIFAWFVEQGFRPDSPAAKIKAPHVPPTEKQPFTEAEITAILAACERIGFGDYERRRAKAAILLMRYTGLRISDAIMLRRDAIKGGVLTLRTQKTKQLVIHDLNIVPGVLEALASLSEPLGVNGNGNQWFFWNGVSKPQTFMSRMERVLRQVFILSGVPNAHCHRFRHTYASDMLTKGASVWLVAKQLGITTAICDKVYGHMTADYQRQVREATLRAFGRVDSQNDG